MRRKIKDSVIDTLEYVCLIFTVISALISFIILIGSIPSLCETRDIGVTRHTPLIAFIWFVISFICFLFISGSGRDCNGLDFLRERNDKIDEEEKARQQALLLEAEERNRAELQIWVSE